MKIRTCPFCNIETTNSPHIYGCKMNNITKNKKEIKYLYILHNFKELSKETLQKEYQIDKMSLPDIREKYDIDFKSILFLLNYYDIKVRSISESTKLTLNKKIKTCLKKYGVDHYSQKDLAKESKKKTFIEKYGIDNVWKSEYFKKNLDKYFFEKHGFNRSDYYKNKWINKSEEEKSKIIKDWYSKCSYSSGLEKRIRSILDDMGIRYISNEIINDKSFDIIIENKIIEIQGDFWHANPNRYNPDDVLNFPGGKKPLAKELWIKDKNKRIFVENLGYDILYLWESDINKKSDIELSKIILEFIQTKID